MNDANRAKARSQDDQALSSAQDCSMSGPLAASQWVRHNGNALLHPIAPTNQDANVAWLRDTQSMATPSKPSFQNETSGVLATRRRLTELIHSQVIKGQNGASRFSEGRILQHDATAQLSITRSFHVPELSSRKAVMFDLELGGAEVNAEIGDQLLKPIRSSPHLDAMALSTGPHLYERNAPRGRSESLSHRPFASPLASFNVKGSSCNNSIAMALAAGVGGELSAHQIAQIEEPTAMPKWKMTALRIHSHRYFYAALVVCTLFVIFEDDFKRAVLPPAADLPLEIGITLIIVFFVIEMVFGSLVKPGYFLGFYFTIDAIAISCLFFQVPNVKSTVLGINSSVPSLQYQGEFITEMSNLMFVFAKTALVAKIFRLLYLLRLFSLYERFETRRSIRKRWMDQGFSREDARKMEIIEMEIMNSEILNQGSRVGTRLQELTIRRVVFGVLLLILLLPGFDPAWGLWGTYVGVDRGGLLMLHQMALQTINASNSSSSFLFSPGFNAALQSFELKVPYDLGSRSHTTSNIVFLQVANQIISPFSTSQTYRYLELYQIEYRSLLPMGCNLTQSECVLFISSATYDWRWYSELTSILNIARSIFLILLFSLGVFFLNRDNQELVIKPVQRMLSIVQSLADNPLGRPANLISPVSQAAREKASESGTSNNLEEPKQPMIKRMGIVLHQCIVRAAEYFFNGHPSHGDRHEEPHIDTYETLILEQSMQKIGLLLAVGFGDAGAEIIAENMRNQGDLNPMLPGRRVASVFGFCDIRQFTDTTEVLQESIMEFVNTIAKIVHISVALHGGAANKNIGDAFLMAWKFPRQINMEVINRSNAENEPLQGSTESSHIPLYRPPLFAIEPDPSLRDAGLDAGLARKVSPFSPFSSSPMPPSLMSALPPTRTFSRVISSRKDPSPSTSALLQQAGSQRGGAVAPISFLSRASSLIKSNKIQPMSIEENEQAVAKPLQEIPGGESEALRQLAQMRISQIKATQSTNGSPVHELDEPYNHRSKETREIINLIADNSLASFIIIQACLKRSERLARYCSRGDIQERLGKGFRVKMGFGLHVGWAIEGAIGSEFKIDASYLSPNVNMASRLEAATKQYAVPLLLSGEFVSCLSPFVRSRVRQIDRVTVKGSNQPVDLFTYDVSLQNIQEPTPSQDVLRQQLEDLAEEERLEQMLQREFQDEWEENTDLTDTWGIDPVFKDKFDVAFKLYLSGQWLMAQEKFEALADDRDDGPTETLLRYMAKTDFTAPSDWRGYRELTEK